MAHESSVRVGSGVSVLRAGLVPGNDLAIPGMRGSNSVVINYEDINSKMGIVQSSGLHVADFPVHVTGAAERLRGRRQMMIQNLGPSLAYIGDSTVTTTGGLCVPSGTILTLNVLDVGNIFAISAGTSDLRILELK
jgi:hypothetical protein